MAITLTSTQLNQLLRDHIGSSKTTIFCDRNYALVDDSGASDFFFKISQQARGTFGMWQQEVADCDKFARLTQSIGLVSHALSWWDKKDIDACGLAIAVVGYVSKMAGPHAINAMITSNEDGKKNIRYYEPQTGLELNLTLGEIKSISFILF